MGAIGSQNRLAARLCGHATDSQILLCPATAGAVERGASWREERVHLKEFDDGGS